MIRVETQKYRFWFILLSLLIFSIPVKAEAVPQDIFFNIESVCAAMHVKKQDGGRIDLGLEVAISPDHVSKGLMFREYLPPRGGMIFAFDPPQSIEMWMKNTLIPLDILFVAPDGTIIHIHENAVPHDLTPLPSGGVVRYAVELRGGKAAELGLKPGDYFTDINELFRF